MPQGYFNNINSASSLTLTNPIEFKGAIAVNTDFPLIATVQIGWFYRVTANVTDNAGASYTNTGQSFTAGDEIAWNGTDWSELGSSDLWGDDSTDIYTLTSTRGMKAGYAKLADTNQSNYLKILWNENDTSDRVLNLLVSGGDRSLTLAGNLTVTNSFVVGATNGGEIDFTAASKKLDIEDNAVVNQDLTTDASVQFAGLTIPGSGSLITIGTTTNLATPAIVLRTNNSGYANPSNCDSDSDGDKWVFWNGATYKGAIGFSTRTMWFQSTDSSAVIANRFKFYGGSASAPVELVNLGDDCFCFNEGRQDIDFEIYRTTSGFAYVYDFGAESHTWIGSITFSTLNTANGILRTDGSGNVTSSIDLPDGTTATTQSPSDNSTKIATTAYVDAAIGTVNTWDEIIHLGSSTTIANTENLSVTINQNDVTNNPAALIITNTGSGNDITLPNSAYIKNGDAVFTNLTGTLQTAAQGNITSLGTLTTLIVDDITINGNAITSGGASSLTITPTAGQKFIIDSHFGFDGTAFTAETDANTTFTAYAGKNITIESVTFDGGVVAGVSTLESATSLTANNAILTGGTNTFALTNGTASLDVAAGATINLDASLTLTNAITLCTTNAGTIDFGAVSKTLTISETSTIDQNLAIAASVQFASITDGTITITGGNLTGATGISATNLTGTLQTAAQTNITSLGTLTALTVDNIDINGNSIGTNIATNLYLSGQNGVTIGSDTIFNDVDVLFDYGEAGSTTLGILAIRGLDSSINGPHTVFFTSTDTSYPVFQQFNYTHDTIAMYFDSYSDGTNERSSDVGSNYRLYKNSDELSFSRASSVAAGSTVTFSRSMALDTSGRVYFGETNPSDIQVVNVRSYSDTPSSWKGSGAFGYSTATVIMGELNSAAQIGGHASTLSGWVDLYINSGGGNIYMPTLYNNGDATPGRDVYVQATGELTYNSSVLEAKINIENLDDISFIYELNPKYYNARKKDISGNYTDEFYPEKLYGLIAEDVELINPDFVFYDEIRKNAQSNEIINKQYDGQYPEEEYIIEKKLAGVHYRKMIPVLIKACQEQKKLIDSLEARISILES